MLENTTQKFLWTIAAVVVATLLLGGAKVFASDIMPNYIEPAIEKYMPGNNTSSTTSGGVHPIDDGTVETGYNLENCYYGVVDDPDGYDFTPTYSNGKWTSPDFDFSTQSPTLGGEFETDENTNSITLAVLNADGSVYKEMTVTSNSSTGSFANADLDITADADAGNGTAALSVYNAATGSDNLSNNDEYNDLSGDYEDTDNNGYAITLPDNFKGSLQLYFDK